MPSPDEILGGLTDISRRYGPLAVFWHIMTGAILVLFALGKRPDRRLCAAGLSLPLFSVSILAWISGDPFNGTILLMTAMVLLVAGVRLGTGQVKIASGVNRVLGLSVIGFGWIYPHFVDAGSLFSFLYKSPLGLIPCPSLALVTGTAIVFNGFGSRRWSAALVVASLFYGAFGLIRLGVWIDIVLLAGSLWLAGTVRGQSLAMKPEVRA